MNGGVGEGPRAGTHQPWEERGQRAVKVFHAEGILLSGCSDEGTEAAALRLGGGGTGPLLTTQPSNPAQELSGGGASSEQQSAGQLSVQQMPRQGPSSSSGEQPAPAAAGDAARAAPNPAAGTSSAPLAAHPGAAAAGAGSKRKAEAALGQQPPPGGAHRLALLQQAAQQQPHARASHQRQHSPAEEVGTNYVDGAAGPQRVSGGVAGSSDNAAQLLLLQQQQAAEEEELQALRKTRLVWTQELHNRFINSLTHLGLRQAVPKSILGLMNVEGMTRENVASHLQKYRLYLKKIGGLSDRDRVNVDTLQKLHEQNVQQMAAQHQSYVTMQGMQPYFPQGPAPAAPSQAQQAAAPSSAAPPPQTQQQQQAPYGYGLQQLQAAAHSLQYGGGPAAGLAAAQPGQLPPGSQQEQLPSADGAPDTSAAAPPAAAAPKAEAADPAGQASGGDPAAACAAGQVAAAVLPPATAVGQPVGYATTYAQEQAALWSQYWAATQQYNERYGLPNSMPPPQQAQQQHGGYQMQPPSLYNQAMPLYASSDQWNNTWGQQAFVADNGAAAPPAAAPANLPEEQQLGVLGAPKQAAQATHHQGSA